MENLKDIQERINILEENIEIALRVAKEARDLYNELISMLSERELERVLRKRRIINLMQTYHRLTLQELANKMMLPPALTKYYIESIPELETVKEGRHAFVLWKGKQNKGDTVE